MDTCTIMIGPEGESGQLAAREWIGDAMLDGFICSAGGVGEPRLSLNWDTGEVEGLIPHLASGAVTLVRGKR